jgi:2-C-methyl-D-erythritol 4-phosphate cytidylyltransferase
MKQAVVLVAGGAGHRMGGSLPKQYLELAGKPLIIHTLERFLHFDPEIKIILVVAAGHLNLWNEVSAQYDWASRIKVAHGGATRYESVKNGLQQIGDGWIVGIHDAVRPLVSQETLQRCYATAASNGSAIPVIEMDESVRMVDDHGKSSPVDRSRLKRVQTPQVFKSEMISEAYRQICDPSLTDDASVFESLYNQVTLVEGNRQNIKITTPIDMELAFLLIRPAD